VMGAAGLGRSSSSANPPNALSRNMLYPADENLIGG
jgi:hypothetical protein